MSNRNLTAKEIEALFTPILDEVNGLLDEAASGDVALRFALNRKLFKELSYTERGKPGTRKIVKLKKYAEQTGICPECNKQLPQFGKEAHLDRRNAIDGYTLENTDLVHGDCHRLRQARKGFA